MKPFSDEQILASWKKNVRPWVDAVRKGEIPSRVAVTNRAILDGITERNPKKVLDVGCGEGWLVRQLVRQGIDSLGIDAVSELITYARNEQQGRFLTLAYDELSQDAIAETFDVVVCNFSLLGNDTVTRLFERVPTLLNQGGAFIVQTLHPATVCGQGANEDGWREGSWEGFSEQFCDPAPWYFRTQESWERLFKNSGFLLTAIHEPSSEKNRPPVSILFVGELTD